MWAFPMSCLSVASQMDSKLAKDVNHGSSVYRKKLVRAGELIMNSGHNSRFIASEGGELAKETLVSRAGVVFGSWRGGGLHSLYCL
jgi:hypothetical protein